MPPPPPSPKPAGHARPLAPTPCTGFFSLSLFLLPSLHQQERLHLSPPPKPSGHLPPSLPVIQRRSRPAIRAMLHKESEEGEEEGSPSLLPSLPSLPPDLDGLVQRAETGAGTGVVDGRGTKEEAGREGGREGGKEGGSGKGPCGQMCIQIYRVLSSAFPTSFLPSLTPYHPYSPYAFQAAFFLFNQRVQPHPVLLLFLPPSRPSALPHLRGKECLVLVWWKVGYSGEGLLQGSHQLF